MLRPRHTASCAPLEQRNLHANTRRGKTCCYVYADQHVKLSESPALSQVPFLSLPLRSTVYARP